MKLSIYQYKPDQGRLARGMAFWLITALNYYGCRTLYYYLSWDWAQNPLIEKRIPIVNIPLNPTFVISSVVFLAFVYLVIRLINSAKLGTLLIETETEMKKVTWPTLSESFNSSIVVLVAVIFFLIFLGVSDFCLDYIFKKIIFGG